jgi:excisionase family DNA binding protein
MNTVQKVADIEKMALNIDEAAEVSGFGRSTIRREIAQGRLRAKKLGARVTITAPDFAEWLKNLPDASPASSTAA